jgi:hypothetical protein
MRKLYFNLTLVLLFVAPALYGQGDNCATAASVTPGAYVADGPATGAGALDNCFGWGGISNADWYTYTPSCDGVIDVYSCDGGQDTRVTIFSGSCGSLSCVSTGDDDCQMYPGGPGFASYASASVTAGTTYYIQWDDYWTAASFGWVLEFTPGGGVTGVSATPTAVSAMVDWNPAGAETDWTIEYGIAGFVQGTGTSSNVLVSNATLSGLNPLTTYEYYIMAGAGPCFIGPFSFTTLPLCPEPTGTFVSGVTTDAATLNWTAGGLESMWDVEWDTEGFLLGSGNQDYGLVANTDPLTGLSSLTEYHWYVRAVCDVNLGDGIDTVSFFVGPLSFETGQICDDPTGLGVLNIDAFETDLDWTPGALETEWNIQWGEAGFTPFGVGANLISNVTSYPYNLTGLTPNTDYEFYVQAVCGITPDSLSSWIGPFFWTTDVYCVDPSGLSSTGFTTTGATINWMAGGLETEWTYEYGLSGFTPGTGTSVTTASTTANLTGLTPGSDYCFYVQANCGSSADSSSNWVGPNCFSTLVACPPPTNLGAINITNTAANLLWQAGGSETAWNIEWGWPGFVPGAGEEVGSVNGTSANPYYATGLTESNSYEFYVQGDCGGSGTSEWTGPYSFNTLFTNDVPCDAIELGVNAPYEVYSNVLATNNAGESLLLPPSGSCDDNMSWCGYGIAVNKAMWFKFKANATGTALISTKNDVTVGYESHTEIAVYQVGICDNYATYTLLAANSGSGLTVSTVPGTAGSEAVICTGLVAGQDYYVMVDGFTYDPSGWGFGGPSLPFSGPFGISVSDIPTPEAGTSLGAAICENTGSFDLFQTITGNSSTNGQWYNPDVQPGNEVDAILDFTGIPAGTYDFFYVDGTVCGTDEVMTSVTVQEGPDAGSDGFLTTCNTADIWLVTQLQGNPQMGGTWTDDDNTGGLHNGLFIAMGVAPGTYDFTYTVSGGAACPDATSTVSITLADCLGMEETGSNTLSVYPNPVVDVLTLQNLSIEGNAVIEVLDIQGKVISSVQVNGVYGNYELNMKNLERGVYVVRLTGENLKQEVRVVKQ